MEPLDSGERQIDLPPAPPLAEPGDLASQAPEAQAAQQPDLAAQLQELRDQFTKSQEELGEERRRREESQGWGQSQHQAALAAQTVVQALQQSFQQQETQRRAEQEYYQRMAPPAAPAAVTITDEEREAMLQDPRVMENILGRLFDYTNQVGKYASDFTQAQVLPHVHRLMADQQEIRQAVPLVREVSAKERRRTEKEARELAAEKGIDSRDFDELLPAARQIFDSMPDRVTAAQFSMRPDMVVTAVQMAQNQNGVPIKKQRPAASLGAGTHVAPNAPVSTPADDHMVREMEKALGRKFTPETLAEWRTRKATATQR